MNSEIASFDSLGLSCIFPMCGNTGIETFSTWCPCSILIPLPARNKRVQFGFLFRAVLVDAAITIEIGQQSVTTTDNPIRLFKGRGGADRSIKHEVITVPIHIGKETRNDTIGMS